ncbi:MAG: TonB-dependent receptor [Litoreibacter sp.]
MGFLDSGARLRAPNARALLRASTALAVSAVATTSAYAQDVDLGTLVLGESKREVQTDTAVAVTTVDQDEINDRQASTIAEIVDSVPGVNLVNGSTPQGSGINIRGFGANSVFGTDQKVAIVVDGANVGAEEIYRVGTQLFTDPSLYRSVDVIRGTIGSFEYGTGIVGGAVILDTKDASDFTGGEPGFNLRQTLEFSSNGDGFTNSTILAWQPTKDLELLGNFVWREQNEQSDGDGNTIGNSAFELPSVLLKGKYTFGAARDQSLTFSYTDSRTDENDVVYDTFLTSDAVFGNVDRTVDSRTASLTYKYNPETNDLVDLEVILSYADQEIDQEYVPGSSSCEGPGLPCGFAFPVGGFGVVNADLRYETTKLSIKNASLFDTGIAQHELRAGLELIRKDRLDADSAPGGRDDRIAVFAVDEISIGDAWTVTPALRFESSDIQGSTAPNDGNFDNDALVGGLSVRYEFQNGFAVFASGAYTESLPILDDLGNPTFITQSEKSDTWEIGASYDGIDVFTPGDALAVKANIYQTRLRDVTSYQASGLPFGTTIDSIELEGLELEASYAMENGFYADLNATIATGTEFQPGGTSVPWRGIPADGIQFTVGKRFGETLDLSWEVVADRRYTDSTTDIPGFGIHNLRATYIPQSGTFEGVEVRVGIENAFDKDFTRRLSTRPAPGRNVKLTLAKTF